MIVMNENFLIQTYLVRFKQLYEAVKCMIFCEFRFLFKF